VGNNPEYAIGFGYIQLATVFLNALCHILQTEAMVVSSCPVQMLFIIGIGDLIVEHTVMLLQF